MSDIRSLDKLIKLREYNENGGFDPWGINIVILQRGWVVIGDLYKNQSYFLLKNGYVIRRWGTTAGLGQLALEGKKEETILDKISNTKFHEITTIGIIECTHESWIKICS